jgi:hypothetical protein
MKKFILIIAIVLISLDCYSQSGWYRINIANNPCIYVGFPTQTTGIIFSRNGFFYKSTDGGNNWNLSSTGGVYYMRNGAMYDSLNFLLLGQAGFSQGLIRRTTDGGNNWFDYVYNSPELFYSFDAASYLNKDTIVAAGTEATMQSQFGKGVVTYGNNIWNSIFTTSITGAFYDVKFKSKDTICFLLSGQFLKTTNAGINWNGYLMNSGWFVNNFDFQNGGIIYASGVAGMIRKSTNNGVNWFNLNANTTINTRKIFFSNPQTGWIVGDSGLIKRTTNGGLNWENQNSGTNTILNSVYFINSNTGFAVGDSGILLKTTTGGVLTGFTGNETEIPTSYSLSQNYPNPFNPTTNIKFSIVSSPHVLGGDLVQLKVYDVMGREVQTLVNESLKPGTYEATFDGSSLTSGVYFYKLIIRHGGSTTGGFTETKKMLLLK